MAERPRGLRGVAALVDPLVLGLLLGGAEPAPSEVEPEATEQVSTRPVAEAIELDAGATCIDHVTLSAQVTTWLGRERVDSRIEVRVEGDPEASRIVRFTLRADGEVIAIRTFEQAPRRCTDLHAVVGLAIALAIDATVLDTLGVSEVTTPEPPEPVEPEPQPKRELEGVVSAPAPKGPRVRVAASGLVLVAVVPRFGGGAKLAAELGFLDTIDLRVGVLAGLARDREVGSGRGDFTIAAARVDGCVGREVRSVRPRLCVGAAAGGMVGEGEGFAEDRVTTLPWVAAAIGGGLGLRLGKRALLDLEIEAVVPVVRPSVEFVDENGVRQPGLTFARVGAIAGIGLVFELR